MSKKTKKYVAIALCVFLMVSTVIAVNLTSGSSSFAAVTGNKYTDAFNEQYNKIHTAGYFSQEGVPYHSIETLMVEAPDYGHETTSEAFSYYVWLEALNGKVNGDWTGFAKAWDILEKYAIPSEADQPNMSGYNPNKCASFVPGGDDASAYPCPLNTNVPTGADPLDSQLKSAYGGKGTMYAMHWIFDVDNWYGYGNHGDGTSRVSQMNTYQRGEQESCWETVVFPSWEVQKWGNTSKGGFQSLFVDQSSYSKQWRYSVASDADARAVQATYWANKWAKEQGKSVSAQNTKAAKLGDYLRYCLFDKFMKPIGTATLNGPGGTGYNSCHYLVSWYMCWGAPTTAENWAWKEGSSASHQGYQNPMTAYALSTVPELKPMSTNGAADWGKSLDRQLEFLQWLQSKEGAIAGGCNNSIGDRYDPMPAGPKFYGMAYDVDPVWHDPPSNRWFGFQVWGLQRLAEYYYETGNAKAKAILDKWVKWAISQTKFEDGGFLIPSDMSWSGAPDNWNGTYTGNPGLSVNVDKWGTDLGVAGSYANLLTFYAAKSGDTTARDTAQKLLDIMLEKYKDAKGIAVKEARNDYSRFFTQEIYIPAGWTGKNAQGATLQSGMKFIDQRPKYKQDPSWAALEQAYAAGKDFEITYHRFWAQCDIAVALATFGMLFPNVSPITSPTGGGIGRYDLNKDGAINMIDIMLCAGSFNTRVGDLAYKAEYDLNPAGPDGAINMIDIMQIAQYFNKTV